MTPRWGWELQEGRRFSINIPPLRGSIHIEHHRLAFQKVPYKFVAHHGQTRDTLPTLSISWLVFLAFFASLAVLSVLVAGYFSA